MAGKPGMKMGDKHTVDPQALIPAAVSAALGSTAFTATKQLTEEEKRFLSRALTCDVDVWRREFGAQLRTAAQDMLLLMAKELEKIPPAARAYTLAVLVDKAAILEGRTSLQGASVNIQVNNFNGASPKNAILDALEGKGRSLNSDARDALAV
ncbi:MAG TPA: hypothetical protein VEC57_00150 [Candidatus Limnocylindrales bacterium]|nr:hypothetical protein [Candidatus Limnocylindrales bacterium]